MSLPTPDDTEIFRQLEEYPWDGDAQFQGGLSAILGNATSPTQIHELTLRAQCFYLSRKKSIPIDFDAYKSYIAHKSTSGAATETSGAGPGAKTSQERVDGPAPATTEPGISQPPAAATTAASEKGAAPYPPTFAEIVELITSGRPVPGIKDIPPTLLTSQASKPTISKRKKPWEKDVEEEAVQGAGAALLVGDGRDERNVEGTFGDRRDEIVAQDLPDE